MNVDNIKDKCPLCSRTMIKGNHLEDHHLIPKSLKGKEKITLHKICHQKIHSVFTERELQKKFHSIIEIKKNPEIQKFINWISKKEPEFYVRNKASNVIKQKRKDKRMRRK